MQKISILWAVCGLIFTGAASAANVSIYYSPTCPHCHHARDFFGGKMVYEYPTVSVEMVNVAEGDNFKTFEATLKTCNYTSGGVPLIVIGDKCFQGYAPEMDQELRDAVAVDLSISEKAQADANRKAMDTDAEKFKADNANRAGAIVERTAATSVDAQKKTEKKPVIYFYGLLILFVAGLGFVLIRKDKKKK